jgi:hypothetical protein
MRSPESGNYLPERKIDYEEMSRIEDETVKTGKFLANIFDDFPEELYRREPWRNRIPTLLLEFLAHPQGSVFAEMTDFNPPKRNEDTLLRTFKIRYKPSSSAYLRQWLVNESARGKTVSYEPALRDGPKYEHDDERSAVSLDPTSTEMEQARRIMEYCWARFIKGKNDAISRG